MLRDSLPPYQLPKPNDLSVPNNHEVEQILLFVDNYVPEFPTYYKTIKDSDRENRISDFLVSHFQLCKTENDQDYFPYDFRKNPTQASSGKETDTIQRISTEEFAEKFTADSKVIDVRKESEYEAEHVNDAFRRPLAEINSWAGTLDNDEHFFIHCAGGYRSMIAASILNSRGIRNFSEIEGGFNKIKETAVPKSNFVCQSKTL